MSDVKVGQTWKVRCGKEVVITNVKEPWLTSNGQTGIAVYVETSKPGRPYSCWLGGSYDKKDGPFQGDWDLVTLLSPIYKQRQLLLF